MNATRPGVSRSFVQPLFDSTFGDLPGERLVLPEIPCSIDTDVHVARHLHCVGNALHALVRSGTITDREHWRLLWSALRAYREEHHGRY